MSSRDLPGGTRVLTRLGEGTVVGPYVGRLQLAFGQPPVRRSVIVDLDQCDHRSVFWVDELQVLEVGGGVADSSERALDPESETAGLKAGRSPGAQQASGRPVRRRRTRRPKGVM